MLSFRQDLKKRGAVAVMRGWLMPAALFALCDTPIGHRLRTNQLVPMFGDVG